MKKTLEKEAALDGKSIGSYVRGILVSSMMSTS